MSRSAWMAKGEHWITFLRTASGAPSSMRRSTFTIISHRERLARPSHAISRFIITSAFTRHLITKLLLKCIFTRHKQGGWRTQSRRKEKEESSSYLNRFLCLDNVGHHKTLQVVLFTAFQLGMFDYKEPSKRTLV